MDPPLRRALLVGAAAGAVPLLAFAVMHALFIVPTAAVFLDGPLLAGLTGLAAGWAWHLLRARGRLRPSLAHGALFGAALATPLVLVEGVALALGPVDVTSGAVAIAATFLGLTALAGGAGLSTGWAMGRARRPAVAVALAGYLPALWVGGGMLPVGGVGPALSLFAGVLVAMPVAGALLAWGTRPTPSLAA